MSDLMISKTHFLWQYISQSISSINFQNLENFKSVHIEFLIMISMMSYQQKLFLLPSNTIILNEELS